MATPPLAHAPLERAIVSAPVGDILRGMEVERQPLRVGRARAPIPQIQVSAAPVPQVDGACLAELQRVAERAGYEEGHRKGLADAALQAATAVEQAVAKALVPLQRRQEQLDALFASLAAAKDDCLRAAEEDMVALCFDTVCRIVGNSGVQPETVRSLLRDQAARVAKDAGTVLHVHPQDAELLQDHAGTPGAVRYVADPEVALGGCIVRQSGGAIDARLETMLAACKEALLSARAMRITGARL